MSVSDSVNDSSWMSFDNNTRLKTIRADSLTASTGWATAMGRTYADRAQKLSMTVTNRNASDTVKAKVMVSNKSSPDSEVITAANGWSQLGTSVTVANSSADNAQWTGKYKWFAVVAKANSDTTAADVDFDVVLSQ